MLDPAEVVLTISTGHNSHSVTPIAERIPEMDSAGKTTSKTNVTRKFLRTYILAHIRIAPYSVTRQTLVSLLPGGLICLFLSKEIPRQPKMARSDESG